MNLKINVGCDTREAHRAAGGFFWKIKRTHLHGRLDKPAESLPLRSVCSAEAHSAGGPALVRVALLSAFSNTHTRS